MGGLETGTTVGMISRTTVAELLDGTTCRPCNQGCGRPATVEWELTRRQSGPLAVCRVRPS